MAKGDIRKFLAVTAVVGLIVAGCTGKEEPKKLSPQEQVNTKITEFKTGGFDSVMIADFEITNNTSTQVKDITVICIGKSETGTKIDKNERVIYKSIAPGQTVKINEFNMGFLNSNVQTTSCYTSKFVNG